MFLLNAASLKENKLWVPSADPLLCLRLPRNTVGATSERLKNDRDVVLAAVKQNGSD